MVHDNYRSKEIHQQQLAELCSKTVTLKHNVKDSKRLSQLEQDMATLKQELTKQVSQQQAQVEENLTAKFQPNLQVHVPNSFFSHA